MTATVDLTQGPVERHVWRMAPPMAVAFFAMMAFNLADTWFVSKLGTGPLAAMGFTFPLMMIGHSIAMGLGLGVSSCVSRAIGSKDHGQVRKFATYSLLLTLLSMGLLAIVCALSLDHLLQLLGAQGEPLVMARSYMTMLLCFFPFGALPMVGNNAIRATGDTLRPSVIMCVAAVINCILDPLFIFGWGFIPAMGIRGAALATGLSRVLTLFWSLRLMQGRNLLTTEWAGLRAMLRIWGGILHIALPSAATNVLLPLSMGYVTRLIAGFGEAAVAATAAGQRVEHFSYLVPMAMGTTLVPIIGQNWGAGLYGRVRRVWIKTVSYGVIYALLVFLLSIPLARPVASLFSDNPRVVSLMTHYIWTLLAGSVLLHCFVHTGFAFNAIRKPVHASLLTILRCEVLIVLARAGARCLGVQGVYAGVAASFVVVGSVAFVLYNHVLKQSEL